MKTDIMNRRILIDNVISKIRMLPDYKIRELNDFADFLLSRIDEKITVQGIQKLATDSKTFEFLKDEEDLYTINDLKERYK